MGFIICWYSRPCSSTLPPLVSGLTYPCDPGSLMVTVWCVSTQLVCNRANSFICRSYGRFMYLWRVLYMQNGILILLQTTSPSRMTAFILPSCSPNLLSPLKRRIISRLVSHLWPTFSIYSPSSHDNCLRQFNLLGSFGRLAFWLALSQIRLAAEIGKRRWGMSRGNKPHQLRPASSLWTRACRKNSPKAFNTIVCGHFPVTCQIFGNGWYH